VKWLRKYFTQQDNGHVLKHAYNEVNNLLMIISIRTLFSDLETFKTKLLLKLYRVIQNDCG
jgi:hypothetical protein